jgi:hypothetical protein
MAMDGTGGRDVILERGRLDRRSTQRPDHVLRGATRRYGSETGITAAAVAATANASTMTRADGRCRSHVATATTTIRMPNTIR